MASKGAYAAAPRTETLSAAGGKSSTEAIRDVPADSFIDNRSQSLAPADCRATPEE